MKESEKTYSPAEGDAHMKNEEKQWLQIISDPNPSKGMLLVFIQKFCTAFHELAPVLKSGALKKNIVPYISRRLAARADAVIKRLRLNNFDTIDGVADLVRLRERLDDTVTAADIIEMSEEVHRINHRLGDALAGRSKSGEEKRRHRRFPLDVTVDYSRNAKARMKDVGEGGLCLITKEPLIQGVVISLLFDLPQAGEIEAFAKVCWSRKATEHLWETGVEFQDIAPQHMEAIRLFLEAD